MVQVHDETTRSRLRRAGVRARNGLGGVLDGWWVPAWTIELSKMVGSDADLERAIGWVMNTRLGGNPKAGVYPRERLENIGDNDPRLNAVRAAYAFNGHTAVQNMVWCMNPGEVTR